MTVILAIFGGIIVLSLITGLILTSRDTKEKKEVLTDDAGSLFEKVEGLSTNSSVKNEEVNTDDTEEVSKETKDESSDSKVEEEEEVVRIEDERNFPVTTSIPEPIIMGEEETLQVEKKREIENIVDTEKVNAAVNNSKEVLESTVRVEEEEEII